MIDPVALTVSTIALAIGIGVACSFFWAQRMRADGGVRPARATARRHGGATSVTLTENDLPVVTLEPIDAPPRHARPLEASPALIRNVSSLVSGAGDALRRGTGPQTYLLRFSREAQNALSRGELTLMRAPRGGVRSSAVRGGSVIVENGVLIPVSGAATAGVLAAWQVISILVAQAHLMEISERLRKIEEGLREIAEDIHDDRVGRLRGALRRGAQIFRALKHEAVTEADVQRYIGELSRLETECLQVAEAFDRQTSRALAALDSTETTAWRAHTAAAGISEAIGKFDSSASGSALAHQARAALSALLVALPVPRAEAAARVGDVAADAARLQAHVGEFDGTARAVIRALHGRLSFAETEEELRAGLRDVAGATSKQLNAHAAAVVKLTTAVRKRLSAESQLLEQPLELIATVDSEGTITEISRPSTVAKDNVIQMPARTAGRSAR